MLNRTIDILYQAKQHEIDIVLSEGQLQLKFPRNKEIDKDLLRQIKDNKESIIDFLKNSSRNTKTELKITRNELDPTVKIPLSFNQERLWFIHRLEGSVQYHMPIVLRLTGKLNTPALENALKTILDRHEILRSVFLEEEGTGYQFIKDNGSWAISHINGEAYKDDLTALEQLIDNLIKKPFNLSKDYMLRASLISLDADEHILCLTIHHIASDGWSIGILVKEVVELYSAYDEERPVRLQPLPVQYADFAIWQRQFLTGPVLEKKLAYWKEKLNGVATLLQLPLDYSRPAIQSTKGASLKFSIDEMLSVQLQELSRQQGATIFMTLLSVFKVLLFRYSGQQDICVGSPIAGRQRQEVEELIGFFINTLALRTQLDNDISFTKLLQLINDTTMEAYENQEMPFEIIVDTVARERDMSRSPVFQVMFILQNTPDVPNIRLKDLQLTRETSAHNTSRFDLTFSLIQTANGLHGTVEYCTELFKEETILRMIGHFKALMNAVVKAPNQKIGLLPMLSYEEEQQLLVTFNTTSTIYPRDKTIVTLFEEQVLKTPEAIAIIFEEKQLSYRQLHERSNQLAHYLQSKGIGKETLVPICIERGIAMVVGLLGILKAGGAYVPVDPEYPQNRISYMLEDTGAAIVIGSRQSRSKIAGSDKFDLIEIDEDWQLISMQPVNNLDISIDPKQLAYVIYTSGSTGKPKGVMIEHTSVVNLLISIAKDVHFKPCSVFLSVTTFSFDISYLELYMPLVTGGKLIIMPAEVAMDGFKLSRNISKYQPTHLQGTPSTWQILLDGGWQNKEQVNMLVGGEALKEDLKSALTRIGNVWNVYGPTETTIWSTIKKLENHQKVLIGKPIANTNIQVVNPENGLLVPIGVSGEIMIGGDGLARGYYKRPDLTGEKFIANRFSAGASRRMYRTGDLGRWLSDGNIECFGRIDEQVKIRGYRIELGEIETALVQTGTVRQCVILAREDKSGNKRLVAYIVAEGAFDKQLAITNLKGKLPEYMVPAIWVQLETLPLTPNGKINKKALPDPDVNELVTIEYIAPRNELETKLAVIWQNLLHVERVGIRDNFFELGGHSLLVMRLVSVIRKELQLEVEIKSLFLYPTIATLAAYIETLGQVSLLPSIEVKPRPEHIPLSFSQERLWFIDRLEGSVQYHIPAVLRLKGDIDKDAMERALKTIVDRHEALRTVFLELNGEVYQYIQDIGKWELSFVDGSKFKEDNRGLKELIKKLILKPFDLSKDFMVRANLVTIKEQEHLLVVNIHHIAADGWSMPIMVKEFAALYSSFKQDIPVQLAPIAVQYADYSIWQRDYLKGDVLERKVNFWKQKLAGIAPLQLPTDYSRPIVQSTNGATFSFKISKDLGERLHVLSQQQGCTLFMTLLAAFKILLYRYSGQPDICVGTPIANRGQQEVEGLIGFFVNTLALRSQVDKNLTFTEFLQQLKATTLEAYQHQEVPFEKVVEVSVKERDMSRSPLFQVMFLLQNLPDEEKLRLGDVELSGEASEHTTSKFDLTFNLKEDADGLHGFVEYCTNLYNEQTIARMTGHFNQLLAAVVNDPLQRIALLPILTKSEEQQLVEAFSGARRNYPKNKTIVNLVEEQAALTPDSVALVFEGNQLSYRELNGRCNQFAHYLRSIGVKEETLVPVCIERGFEMIIGMLGILKAGGAYVPIDPAYPAERIKYMLEDSAASIIVISKATRLTIPAIKDVHFVEIDGDQDKINRQPAHDLQIAIAPFHLAYVIYTSGSTGKPKGVMIEHKNLYSFICWCKEEFLTSHFDIVYASTSICFDLSVFEIFYPLSIGKPVRIIEHGLELGKYLATDSFVLINSVPVIIENLLKEQTDVSNISVINMAGEPVPYQVQQSLDTEKIEVRNLYGPTEDTTYSTMYTLSKDAPVLIGKPLHDKFIRILDKDHQLVPIGITGEIYIGGSGLARGYLNQPELTAERFIKNPFSKEPGSRLYKTGDVGKWLPGGNIDYQGRMDDQVKIRGYRIELGEIETILLQSGLIKQAVVLARPDSQGNKRLAGYVVAAQGFDKDSIIFYLRKRLPEFMIPTIWLQLETIPLTANGKVDRKALPSIDEANLLSKAYTAPVSKTEQSLTAIWKHLLGIERIGMDDNFFELGGHSLLAMRVISSIRKNLNLQLQIKDLFFHPTIASLAIHLQQQNKAILLPSIEIQTRPEYIPLSFSQERLWFINSLEGSYQYHIPVVLRLKGNLNNNALLFSLQSITDRHEILRTVFREENGRAYQLIHNKGSWGPSLEDGSGYKKNAGALKLYIETLVNAPFNLSKDYPVRGSLISISDQEHILVVTMHHIASDAWSMSVIVKEVVELYNSCVEDRAAALAPLPVQFADYAIWQRNYLEEVILDKKLQYWKNKLEGSLPLQLPTDYSRPKLRTNRGASTRFSLDRELYTQLNELAQQNGASLFMVLMATFKVLLHRYSGQQDICVGASIANRPQEELENLIGFFVNTVALRTAVLESDTFTALLQSVKTTVLEAYEHQDVPFEKVVEEVVKERDPGRTPLFQVLMVLLNTPEPSKLGFGEVVLTQEPVEIKISKFDISFHVAQSASGLNIVIIYNRDLFNEDTIIRMGGHFNQLLNAVVKDPLQCIDSLQMLTEEEEKQLLIEFN